VIVFPNCKINIGLNVLRKRNDGYHEIETIFYPTTLQDVLEIVSAPADTENSITVSGITDGIPFENNICLKACRLLQNDFSHIPFLRIHLHKVIPSGAGLGGGSADAAFTLILLNQKFNLGISESDLLKYALQLGSDCPFFILNRPSIATGRGEILEPVSVDLSLYNILLVNPGIHISTPEAFSSLLPSDKKSSLKNLISLPVDEWKDVITNDFETNVFKKFPLVEELKNQLYQRGAKYASMTGSGSTVFGLFKKGSSRNLQFPPGYFVHFG
jgi:4-diphosphocytidyl-2-C-methyl-D-erythritol kinase